MKKTVLLIVTAIGMRGMVSCHRQQQELVEVPVEYRCSQEEVDEHPIFKQLNYRCSPEGAYIGLPKDTAARVSAIVDAFLVEVQSIYEVEAEEWAEDCEMFGDSGEIHLAPTVFNDHVGIAGSPTFEYELAEYMCSLLTRQQLVTMAVEHPEAVIRGYVSNIVLNKYPHEAVEIAIHGMADTADIHFWSGCIGGRETLNEFRVIPLVMNKEHYQISDQDYERLERTILYSDQTKQFDAWGRLYENMEPKPEYYSRLKSLFDPKQYIAPIIAIVKYRREEDKQLLLSLLQNGDDETCLYMAVSAWPDVAFAPALRNRVLRGIKNNECTSNELFLALMQYEEPWALSLIEALINNCEYLEKRNAQFYFEQAYSAYPTDYFKPIYDRLLQKE